MSGGRPCAARRLHVHQNSTQTKQCATRGLALRTSCMNTKLRRPNHSEHARSLGSLARPRTLFGVIGLLGASAACVASSEGNPVADSAGRQTGADQGAPGTSNGRPVAATDSEQADPTDGVGAGSWWTRALDAGAPRLGTDGGARDGGAADAASRDAGRAPDAATLDGGVAPPTSGTVCGRAIDLVPYVPALPVGPVEVPISHVTISELGPVWLEPGRQGWTPGHRAVVNIGSPSNNGGGLWPLHVALSDEKRPITNQAKYFYKTTEEFRLPVYMQSGINNGLPRIWVEQVAFGTRYAAIAINYLTSVSTGQVAGINTFRSAPNNFLYGLVDLSTGNLVKRTVQPRGEAPVDAITVSGCDLQLRRGQQQETIVGFFSP
jgi:hypothetical protein